MKSSHSDVLGSSLCRALGVLFIALKLTGHIDWDWIWVLAPLWIHTIFLGVILLATFVVAALDKD